MTTLYDTIGATEYDTPAQLKKVAQKKADQIKRAHRVLSDPIERQKYNNTKPLLTLWRFIIGIAQLLITLCVWVGHFALIAILFLPLLFVLKITGLDSTIISSFVFFGVWLINTALLTYIYQYRKTIARLKSFIPYPQKPVDLYRVINTDKRTPCALIKHNATITAQAIDAAYHGLLNPARKERENNKLQKQREKHLKNTAIIIAVVLGLIVYGQYTMTG